MDNWIKQVDYANDISFIATRMEILLDISKKNTPTKDFSEQEKIIKMMRNFEFGYLELCEYKRQLRKLTKELFEENTTLRIEILKIVNENATIKEENKNLRESISI